MVDMPTIEIAQKLGVQITTMRQWIRRDKWVDARKAIKSRGASIVAQHVLGAAQDAVLQHQTRVAKVYEANIDSLSKIQVTKPQEFVQVATALKGFDDVARRNLGIADSDQPSQSFSFHLIGGMPPDKVLEIDISSDTSADKPANITE